MHFAGEWLKLFYIKGKLPKCHVSLTGETTLEFTVHSSCHFNNCSCTLGWWQLASTWAFSDGWWEGNRFSSMKNLRGQRSFTAAPGRFTEALDKAAQARSREQNRSYRTQVFLACSRNSILSLRGKFSSYSCFCQSVPMSIRGHPPMDEFLFLTNTR